ncbi:MAG: hypothetical protein ACYC91_13485 [Solirubrobacteraceae bacterium]
MSFPPRLRPLVSLAAIVATVATVFALPATAAASTHQLSIFEDDIATFSSPYGFMHQMRTLGVGVVRLAVRWSEVAPAPRSFATPRFNAANSGSYPRGTWNRFDTVDRAARANGIKLLLVLSGPAPLWATGPGQPSGALPQWKPSASGYYKFVIAVASRYSGHYGGLPAVRLWEIWNEPNWGQDLSPQSPGNSSTLESPAIYRGLLNAGWSALHRTGHGRDTIMVGSLSPRGHDVPGNTLAAKPMIFVRDLYCLNGGYRVLRGGAAARLGCPTSFAASRRFRSANPALFNATGFGAHPYPYNLPPNRADSRDPNFVEFNEIPHLYYGLDRAQRAYGSRKRLVVYDTEYGYETNPPNQSHRFVSPETASGYINWAEYLSWRDPRIVSTMQFLLEDPNPTQGASLFGYGGFAAGLVFYGGKAKSDYYAYRMPIYMPSTQGRRHRPLELWGCVRPAVYLRGVQRALIQLARSPRGPFRTVASAVVRGGSCYFDTRVKFPYGGTVRIAWSHAHATIFSRAVGIRLR